MFTERPWPSSPRFRNIGIAVTFTTLTCAFVWLGMRLDQPLVAALPFFVAVPVGWYFFWPRRCPQCGGRLRTREDPVPDGTKYRILAVCPKCEVNWDTGLTGDTAYDV
jgi:apolipoprotein N-acyltransferase